MIKSVLLQNKTGLFRLCRQKNRKEPWKYDKKRFKRRNEVERFFLRLKRFRKVFTCYDKLDSIYIVSVKYFTSFQKENRVEISSTRLIIYKKMDFIFFSVFRLLNIICLLLPRQNHGSCRISEQFCQIFFRIKSVCLCSGNERIQNRTCLRSFCCVAE